MLEYKLEQKRGLAKDAFMYQFSHVLSWFLHVVADLIKMFIKAFADAAKMLMHI